MPNLSPTMTVGNIVEWKKKEGDEIKQGDNLASIETDKAVVDFEVNEDGYVAKLLYPDGTKNLSVGTPVAILVEDKNDVQAFKEYKEGKSQAQPKQQEKTQEKAEKTEDKPSPKKPKKNLPNYIKLTLPNLSPTMTKGNIVEWKKKEGDLVKPGDVVASIETDKAQVDYEVNEDGYIAKIIYPSGTKDVDVGSLIAVMVEEQSEVEAFKDFTGEDAEPLKEGAPKAHATPQRSHPEEQVEKVKPQSEKETVGEKDRERVFASPLAKRTARDHNVDLHEVKGSGPRGRVIQADVLEHKPEEKEERKVTKKPTTAAPEYEDIDVSQIRKVTAERLSYSKSNIPHFYIGIDLNVDKLVALRTELNKHSPVKLSFNDIIIKAAALACMKVPEANSSWQGDFIRKYKNVDMSVAVQTDNGLMTPIVTNANTKGLAQISKEVKDLAERAKARKLKPNEFQGGTFTISNMGMLGITNFSAVINPPQACILAVSKSEKKVLYDENAKDKSQPYK